MAASLEEAPEKFTQDLDRILPLVLRPHVSVIHDRLLHIARIFVMAVAHLPFESAPSLPASIG